MKIIHVECEGYSGLNEIFPKYGNHYLLPDDEAERFIEKFEEWRKSLGVCKDSEPGYSHPLKDHVHLYEIDIDVLPEMFQEGR